ncbi:reverse transcriptase domain-containing protein [Rhizobium beringeri]
MVLTLPLPKRQSISRKGIKRSLIWTWPVFFDRVHHQRLLAPDRPAREGPEDHYLDQPDAEGGGGDAGWHKSRPQEGTPQGGPLSPLLSNIVLDELDRELARRRLRFVRYADDSNIFVRSERAGQRVMSSIRDFLNGECGCRSTRKRAACAPQMKCTFLGSASAARREKAATLSFFSPGRRSNGYAPKCGR